MLRIVVPALELSRERVLKIADRAEPEQKKKDGNE
jgi:hypothetical protein